VAGGVALRLTGGQAGGGFDVEPGEDALDRGRVEVAERVRGAVAHAAEDRAADAQAAEVASNANRRAAASVGGVHQVARDAHGERASDEARHRREQAAVPCG